MALVHQLFLLLLAVPSKVFLQQEPTATITVANHFHVVRHQLIPGGKILRIEELVDLHLLPFPVSQSPASSSSALHQSSWLVVRTQENHHINIRKVMPSNILLVVK